MFYIYIIQNSSGRFYIGSTQSIEERLIRHNGGRGGKTTKKGNDRKLIHTEIFNTRSEAILRERQLKSLKLGSKIITYLQSG